MLRPEGRGCSRAPRRSSPRGVSAPGRLPWRLRAVPRSFLSHAGPRHTRRTLPDDRRRGGRGPPPRPGGDRVRGAAGDRGVAPHGGGDRKSTRLNSSHLVISYAVFCLKKKKKQKPTTQNKR